MRAVIALAFTYHCFSVGLCVDAAWTSLPILLVMETYMTKSRCWLEHLLSSSSSWCCRLGCFWSSHQQGAHHFPVGSLSDSQAQLGSAWCGSTWPTFYDFIAWHVTAAITAWLQSPAHLSGLLSWPGLGLVVALVRSSTSA